MAVLVLFALMRGVLPAAGALAAKENLPSAWASADIAEATELGIAPGAASYAWQDACARAVFCEMLSSGARIMTGKSLAELADGKDALAFSDCDNREVLAAAALGIVNGMGDGTFEPDGAITREQVAAILARAARVLSVLPSGEPVVFSDKNQFSDWAISGIADVSRILCGDGRTPLMEGMGGGLFVPQGVYTLEQSAVAILRLTKAVSPASGAESRTLYPMSALIDGTYLWGYADREGQFVIAPAYAYAGEWNDGGYGIVSLPEEPGRCVVINRAEERISFTAHESLTLDSFPLSFAGDTPGVRFVGNCLLTPDTVSGMASHSLFSLTDRRLIDSFNFKTYSDGMITGRKARGDTEVCYDQNGRGGFSAYGQLGAFYGGVATSWDGLYDKQGKLVDDHKFSFGSTGDAILVYGLADMTNWVGDSLVFVKPKWKADGSWDAQGYGVVRADGTVILPAVYSYAYLTPCKQILTGRPGETYRLHDAGGKLIYTFPAYLAGPLAYNNAGHYVYRDTDSNVVILSVSGAVTAKFTVSEDAAVKFVGGLVRVTEADGRCRYYDTAGNAALGG